MLTPTERQEIIGHAIDAASRVARDGGIGHVELPHPETGKLTTVEIDQRRAREVICWLNDVLAEVLWKQIRDGQPLALKDRLFLKIWTASTIAESEDAEREHRTESKKHRAQLYLVNGDNP